MCVVIHSTYGFVHLKGIPKYYCRSTYTRGLKRLNFPRVQTPIRLHEVGKSFGEGPHFRDFMICDF